VLLHAEGWSQAASNPSHFNSSVHRSSLRNKRVAISGLAAVSARVLTALIGVVTVPLVMGHVGKEQFGLWMVITSLVVWMQLAEFGVAQGLTNALAEAYGRDDRQAARGYIATALVVTTSVALLSLPFLWLGGRLIPWGGLIGITDQHLLNLAADVMLVVGLAFILNVPLSLAERVYTAYQKGYWVSVAQIVAAFAYCVGIWLVVKFGLGLVWAAALMAAFPILSNLLLWLMLPFVNMPVRIGLTGFRRQHLSRVAASSVPLFTFQCGALLVNQLVNVVIATVANLSVVADFNVIQRLYLFVFSIAAALSNPYYPAIREAFERGDLQWAKAAVRRSLLIRIGATLPFICFFILAGDQIITLWLGKSMASPMLVWGWLAVSLLLITSSASSLLSEVLTSLDVIWAQTGIVFLSAAVVLSLMWVLIPVVGVTGVYLAFAASTVVPIGWAGLRLTRKLES
jgi:O-antigen/teichoic acid export membrane protein